MSEAYLEHANLTVKDPTATAQLLVDLFGWRVRWSGESVFGGHTVHVGGENSYLALYSQESTQEKPGDTYQRQNALNHLGIVVDDLDAAEKTILAAGLQTRSHGDYEPGRRFYFESKDGLEFEIISYK